MKVTKVEILPVKPVNGLIAFASIELENQFYVSCIGIYTKIGGGIRLTYPTKEGGKNTFNICHPIVPELSKHIEACIEKRFKEIFPDSS